MPQPAGAVQLRVISPIQTTFFIAGELAPLLVKPNAVVQLSTSLVRVA
jgi:hypothetical protein